MKLKGSKMKNKSKKQFKWDYWMYGIIKDKHGGYGLHEVYKDRSGKIQAHTNDPIRFGVETYDGITDDVKAMLIIKGALKMAINDIEDKPVYKEKGGEK